ncbi:hypothetical protein [Streptomyces sp. NPDC002533]
MGETSRMGKEPAAGIADGPVTSAVSQTVIWTERIPTGRDK